MDNLPVVLLGVFLALQVCDFATTAYAVKNRKAAEGNKFMAAIMRKVGAIPALAAGKVAAGFAGWYLYAQGDMLILPILCLVYAGVVVNNVRVILQASR